MATGHVAGAFNEAIGEIGVPCGESKQSLAHSRVRFKNQFRRVEQLLQILN